MPHAIKVFELFEMVADVADDVAGDVTGDVVVVVVTWMTWQMTWTTCVIKLCVDVDKKLKMEEGIKSSKQPYCYKSEKASTNNMRPSQVLNFFLGTITIVPPPSPCFIVPPPSPCFIVPKSLDQNSIAIEFDTKLDLDPGDINDNHVGIDLDSIFSVASTDLKLGGINLKSGSWDWT
ncbi:hypothetical protein LXL04_009575 [Taraxacum kok-saghyz]